MKKNEENQFEKINESLGLVDARRKTIRGFFHLNQINDEARVRPYEENIGRILRDTRTGGEFIDAYQIIVDQYQKGNTELFPKHISGCPIKYAVIIESGEKYDMNHLKLIWSPEDVYITSSGIRSMDPKSHPIISSLDGSIEDLNMLVDRLTGVLPFLETSRMDLKFEKTGYNSDSILRPSKNTGKIFAANDITVYKSQTIPDEYALSKEFPHFYSFKDSASGAVIF
jgi:hypothetical protein